MSLRKSKQVPLYGGDLFKEFILPKLSNLLGGIATKKPINAT